MKRIYWTLILAAGLLAACSAPGATRPKAGFDEAIARPVAITAEHAPDQIVVGYEDSLILDAVIEALGGGEVVGQIEALKAALIKLPDGLDASHALGVLRKNRVAGLRYAQPNFKHPLPEPQGTAPLSLNDPLEDQKWDHEVMQAADAWGTDVDGLGTRPDGSGVVIGVVDTGIDGTHPDLAGAFVNGYDATGCLGLPGNVIPQNFDASQGLFIHGTHVAGIAAARGDNGQGVAGVAPGATLMDLKVFCWPFTDDFIIAGAIMAAITDADGDGVVPDVITMSLGGKGYGQVLKDAIDSALTGYNVVTGVALPNYDDGTGGGAAGDGTPDRTVTITVAMGNSSQDEVEYPAGYPGIIAVGATNARDEKADFSTSGGHISVSAPGVDILSTWPTWDLDPTGKPYLYYRISGTSMATPQVAGAVALVKQFLPAASAYEVRRLLETTADDIGPAGFDRGTGWGRINLKKLVDAVSDVLAGGPTETGGTAAITVTTDNIYDTDGDGTLGSAGDQPMPLANVDVQLLQGGVVKYVAKTNDAGVAFFTQIAPGDYDVLVSGEDITDWTSWAVWPHERVSWDADGDPSNGVTLGSLTVNGGSTFASPDALAATLNTTMQVKIEWTGGGDLDLAVWEYDPATSTYRWSTPKTGALWGSFSGDDAGADPTHAEETYTLSDTHYPTPASDYYMFSVDASGTTTGATLTVTLTMNGVTKTFGPIPIAPGGDAVANLWSISDALWSGGVSFDNIPTVY